jgi:hypothetical protein
LFYMFFFFILLHSFFFFFFFTLYKYGIFTIVVRKLREARKKQREA